LKFAELAKRNLKEVYRDRVALGFLLGMPLVFILIFGWAFSGETSPALIGVV
jgi:ABC-2 type transport system permease protein